MAFGKKDKDEAVAALETAPEPTDEVETEEVADAEVTPEAEATPAPEAAAPAVDPSDALLSMFESTQAESEDITQILELAGDVAIDDLLDELHTVAAALGIDTSPMASYDDEDLLAA